MENFAAKRCVAMEKGRQNCLLSKVSDHDVATRLSEGLSSLFHYPLAIRIDRRSSGRASVRLVFTLDAAPQAGYDDSTQIATRLERVSDDALSSAIAEVLNPMVGQSITARVESRTYRPITRHGIASLSVSLLAPKLENTPTFVHALKV
jgi:hypothetical protein